MSKAIWRRETEGGGRLCAARLCVQFVSVCEGGDSFAQLLEFKYFGCWFALHIRACLKDMKLKTLKCEWSFQTTQQISSISSNYAAGMLYIVEVTT